MATPQEEMADLIYDVFRGTRHKVYMYDANNKQIFDPKNARKIWSDSQKIMVTIGYTKGKPPKPQVTFHTSDVTDMKKFNQMKFALKRHNPSGISFRTLPFDWTLVPKHLEHVEVTEQRVWSGSTRTSYFPINGVLLVIKHSKPWHKDTLDQAQRWRRIKHVMLHTPNGERFQFPLKHVMGAKAMAQHLSQSNTMHDQGGALIQDLTKSLQSLSSLQRKAKRLNALPLMNQIQTTRGQIKKLLSQIAETKTYDAGLHAAKKMLQDWKEPSQTAAVPTLPVTFREARELLSWFEDFDPQIQENKQSQEDQVNAAWISSDGDIYQTLDYLKDNHPYWDKHFQEDPSGAIEYLKSIINNLEKSEK